MGKTIKAIVLALVLGTVLVTAACSTGQSSGQVISNGKAAPDFQLKDLQGKVYSLSALRGKAVLINFWATTCPPCVEEMPHFQALYNDWKSRADFTFLSIDIGEDGGTIQSFMQAHGWNFPILQDIAFTAAQKYQIEYTPTSLVVDANGTIRYSVIGAFPNEAAIQKQVQPYLTAESGG